MSLCRLMKVELGHLGGALSRKSLTKVQSTMAYTYFAAGGAILRVIASPCNIRTS